MKATCMSQEIVMFWLEFFVSVLLYFCNFLHRKMFGWSANTDCRSLGWLMHRSFVGNENLNLFIN